MAVESPHGEGSIAMLVRLFSFWQAKLFVLVLLGFAATDFILTMTLSAADATAHLDENPYWPASLHSHEVTITLLLLALLGGVCRVHRRHGYRHRPGRGLPEPQPSRRG